MVRAPSQTTCVGCSIAGRPPGSPPFSPILKLRAENPGNFAHPVEVFSDWRGDVFYLAVRFAGNGVTAANAVSGRRD